MFDFIMALRNLNAAIRARDLAAACEAAGEVLRLAAQLRRAFSAPHPAVAFSPDQEAELTECVSDLEDTGRELATVTTAAAPGVVNPVALIELAMFVVKVVRWIRS